MYQQVIARDFDQWGELVSSSFVPLRAEPVRAGDFTGDLSIKRLGDVVATQISTGPHAVHRGPELIADKDDTYCKISFQRAGHGLLIQDGRQTIISPGQFAIYDTSRPYTLVFEEDSTSSVLMVPRRRFAVDEHDLKQLTATTLGERHPLSAAVGQFALHCAPLLADLDDAVGHSLTTNVIDLLSTVMDDELYSQRDSRRPQGNSRQRQLLRDVTDYIEENLGDPHLGPTRIAEAHFISLRSLHQLFQGTDRTVAATIRHRRLAHCRDDLRDPAQSRTAVATIGARWGLIDPAHFSRTFRAHYGLPPAEFRTQV